MGCIFCSIVEGDQEAQKVYNDKNTTAFLDNNPASEGHTLVLPRKHRERLVELSDRETRQLFTAVRNVAEKLREKTACKGINIVQSNGEHAGQEIPHVHVHVITRYRNDNINIDFYTED